MFTKILIANRGEIACRIMRTAKEMGIATVAVYSDADSQALHVEMADEAIHIGASAARDSYLQIEKVLAAAKATGAQAIHPGYGFLSENADFARRCEEQGLVFIGPPASAIEAMGSKSAAKQIMERAQVPLVPGYHGDDQNPEILRASARDMGYPVLLKATAGGGGKGMRQVWSDAEFDEALAAAKREASNSFGDDRMLVEKYLTKPRHVELQVFCDNHGNAVYLAERDCSVQRRHQKVIEEAPAPGMTEQLRQQMGETALDAARAINYRGAGTVEFLLDEDNSFYFMEMNTRLQVEHPVTEMITNTDLVKWQLLVAANQTLPLTQEQVAIRGHAFEARIYAEDADNDFLPATGRLGYLQAPQESQHVRVDTGVRQGDEISVYYDPMIAKLIVWDENRERALNRLAAALGDYRIGGTVTNINFLYKLATAKPFLAAQLDTGFIDKHQDVLFHSRQSQLNDDLPVAAVALLLRNMSQATSQSCIDPWSPWQQQTTWRLNESGKRELNIHLGDAEYRVALQQNGDNFKVQWGKDACEIQATLQGDEFIFERDGYRRQATLSSIGSSHTLYLDAQTLCFEELAADTGEADHASAGAGLAAPMNGTVVTCLVAPGDTVDADQPLLVLEAMKMEHTIRAPSAGMVQAFYYQPGDLVDGGADLVDFIATEDS